jgi:hypothetical protein
VQLSPFGDEEGSRRRLSLLAGDPQISYQRRGAQWEVRDGPPIAEAEEPIDGDQARLIRAELRIVDSASITPYDPLRDVPEALFAFEAFGEKVWLNGVAWNDGLIHETIKFHERYGPLVRNESLTAPPVPVPVLSHWLEACRMALAFKCYQSLRPEEAHLRPNVIVLIVESFLWDLALLPSEQAATRQLQENRLIEWSQYQTRYDDADQGSYTRRASVWLNQTINLCLEGFGVRSQVAYSPPSSWFSSYVAPTLGGALWGQLAGFVIEGSTVKQCKYELCQKRFPAQNPRKEYCSDFCKENRKKRERRKRGM